MVVHMQFSSLIQTTTTTTKQEQYKQLEAKAVDDKAKDDDTLQLSNALMANVFAHQHEHEHERAHEQLPCDRRDHQYRYRYRYQCRRATITAAAIKLLLSLWILFMACNCCCWHLVQNATAFELIAPRPPPAVIANALDGHVNVQDYANAPPHTERHETTPPSGVEHHTTDDASASTDDPTTPEEIQKAVCTVTAGEVRASAEAVTTKTLKGVCSSAELNNGLQRLEMRFANDLHEIKLLLQQIAMHNGLQLHIPPPPSPPSPPLQTNGMAEAPPAVAVASQPTAALDDSVAGTTTTSEPLMPVAEPIKFQAISATAAPQYGEADDPPKPSIQLKSLPSSGGRRLSAWREQEVSKFNNTMLSDKDFKVFTYYWKLENFTAHIESGATELVEGPVFSIKGKALHIKAHFQHLHRDFLYLQLAYASSLASSKHNNIMLDMGGAGGFGLFKEITSNTKISFKHKISILDQGNHRSRDLVSQEFQNLDMGFLIPNSALLGSSFIKNDTLLVQIFLYL